MSAAELAEWQAFATIEPFGDDWRRSAGVCAMIGNTASGKRNKQAFQPDDFLPVRRPKPRRMTGAEMLAIFRCFAKREPTSPASPGEPPRPLIGFGKTET